MRQRAKHRDAAQERMRQQHRQRVQKKTEEQRAKVEEEEHINVNVILDPFDETRGRLIIEYFIKHFIALAKKSHEFGCHGQCLMYLMQAENLIHLLKDLRFYGATEHMEFETELEQLRQVARGTPRDYWQISWGTVQDESIYFSGGAPTSTADGNFILNAATHQGDPLPEVPRNQPSPILGVQDSDSEFESALDSGPINFTTAEIHALGY